MKILLLILVLALATFGQQPPLRPVVVTLTSANTDTYAGTASPTLTAYTSGQIFIFTANYANTGAASINVDAVGALTIVKLAGAIDTALIDNDIRNDQSVMCRYDGTNCQMLSQLGNAAAGGGSGAVILVSAWETSGMAQNIVRYTAPGFDQGNVTESLRQYRVLRAGTLSDFGVKTISTAIASGQTLVAVVRINGTDTSITCTITGTGTYCEDLTNSAAVAAGDLIDVRYTTSATTGTIYPAFQLKYVPTT